MPTALADTTLQHATLEDGERILTGVGRRVELIVEAILVESDRPLHFSEIAQRASARAGRSIDICRAHDAAANIGLLYGRGTCGLSKHFPLRDDETDMLISEVENLIENGPPGRQWHCFELCDLLAERGLDSNGQLTPYVVNIALARSSACADLGRLVWTLRRDRFLSTAHRIDVRQAIIAILRQEGRPVTTADLRDRLARKRGLAENFQIFPSGSLIRLPDGLWASRRCPIPCRGGGVDGRACGGPRKAVLRSPRFRGSAGAEFDSRGRRKGQRSDASLCARQAFGAHKNRSVYLSARMERPATTHNWRGHRASFFQRAR
jgi:hypothetical protein